MTAEVRLICDGCGARIIPEVPKTISRARELARAAGAVTRGSKDYCDNCVNEGRA